MLTAATMRRVVFQNSCRLFSVEILQLTLSYVHLSIFLFSFFSLSPAYWHTHTNKLRNTHFPSSPRSLSLSISFPFPTDTALHVYLHNQIARKCIMKTEKLCIIHEVSGFICPPVQHHPPDSSDLLTPFLSLLHPFHPTCRLQKLQRSPENKGFEDSVRDVRGFSKESKGRG